MSQTQLLTFTAVFEDVGQRVDLFLSRHCDSLSRSQIKNLISENRATIEGKICKPSQILQAGDRVSLEIPPIKNLELQAQDLPLDIIYEDSDLLVLNKAAEQVVHPGAGIEEGTLVNALLHHCRDLSGIGGVARPGIIHRLDKGTSGILLIAKNDNAHHSLAAQFQERSVQKTYFAFVWGVPRHLSGSIDKPLGRSESDRKKISVDMRSGREALTHYRVEKSWSEVSLLEIKPKTGRTHQIRVHLTELGHPIIGDPVYGKGLRKIASLSVLMQDWVKSRPYQLLHAFSIEFTHPRSGKKLRFEAPMRQEMLEFKKMLEKERA